jgi:hypothetical protein
MAPASEILFTSAFRILNAKAQSTAMKNPEFRHPFDSGIFLSHACFVWYRNCSSVVGLHYLEPGASENND